MQKLLIRLIGWAIIIFCFYKFYEWIAAGGEFLK
jgi:hypothetical protein